MHCPLHHSSCSRSSCMKWDTGRCEDGVCIVCLCERQLCGNFIVSKAGAIVLPCTAYIHVALACECCDMPLCFVAFAPVTQSSDSNALMSSVANKVPMCLSVCLTPCLSARPPFCCCPLLPLLS